MAKLILKSRHRLMCGDSTMIDDVEKLMNGEKAELLFTSPPYSDMRDYGAHGNEKNVSIISDFITSFYGKYNYIAFNLGIQRKEHNIVEYWNEYLEKAKATGMKFLSWNIWKKNNISIGQQAAFFPIEHEFVFVFGDKFKDINRTVERKTKIKKQSKTSRRQQDGTTKFSTIGEQQELKEMGSVFESNSEVGEARFLHPATFPVEFPEAYILAITNKNDIVIDSFTGSGSTLIACEKTNRKCYGMELDEKYCDVIINRWQNFTGKKAILESNGKSYDEVKNG